MSEKMKVKTEDIVALAKEIGTSNSTIQEEFENVMNIFNDMFNSWDGKAAETGMESYKSINQAFLRSRYSVLDNYVRFLLTSVGEGYVITENINTRLSDNFK